jgi:hypothetical protein
MSPLRQYMYQPRSGLVVTLSWEFLDRYMQFSYITALLIIASQPRLKTHYKVHISFECIKLWVFN